MAFGTATVLTNTGIALSASQVNGTTSTPPKFIAIGSGATTAARTAIATDTVLSTEYTAVARATGTNTIVTTTVTGDTFQTVGTITAAGALAVDEAGLFMVVTSSTGNMAVSATFPVVNLLTGDSIQITGKIKYT
jgi:hypothetical protein